MIYIYTVAWSVVLSTQPADSNAKVDKKEKPSAKNGDSPENDDGEKNPEMMRQDSTSATNTCDPVRIKCRELICKALKTDGM